MRSRELAVLAGVTVRALRHYHQVGVLDEPPRSANGYREYAVHDLVRVLRIKRLAALGIPLSQVSAVLDDTTDSGSVLDDLDRDLQERITQLSMRRELLARIRGGQLSADVPVEVGPYLAMIEDAPEIFAAERDNAVLLHHLFSETQAIPSLHAQFEEPQQVERMAHIARRIASLHPGSSNEDLEAVVADLASVLAPTITAFIASASTAPMRLPAATLMNGLWSGLLNPELREVVRRLERRLAESAGQPAPIDGQ